jgi:hypothetical protein
VARWRRALAGYVVSQNQILDLDFERERELKLEVGAGAWQGISFLVGFAVADARIPP